MYLSKIITICELPTFEYGCSSNLSSFLVFSNSEIVSIKNNVGLNTKNKSLILRSFIESNKKYNNKINIKHKTIN